MISENKMNEMLNELIGKIQYVIADRQKQSFGSLESLLGKIIAARDHKLYTDAKWFIDSPRWLGEYGNTKEEEEIYGCICKIELYLRQERTNG